MGIEMKEVRGTNLQSRDRAESWGCDVQLHDVHVCARVRGCVRVKVNSINPESSSQRNLFFFFFSASYDIYRR